MPLPLDPSTSSAPYIPDENYYGGELEPTRVVAQSAKHAGASLAGLLPYVGPAISALGIGAQMYTNAKNRAMQLRINKQNVDLVREQNAYNSPVAQMARYKAAGLNPLAFMDNITPGNQESVASLGSPQFETPDFGQVGDAVHNSLLYRLQEKQTEQLASLRATQSLLNVVRSGNIELSTEQSAATFGIRKEILESTRDNLVKDLSVKDAEIEKYYASANLDRNKVSEIYARIDNLYAQNSLYRAQVDYYAQMTGIAAWQVKYMDAFYSGYMDEIVDADHQIKFANRDAALAAARAATAEAVVAERTIDDRVSGVHWSKEATRAQAGINTDRWNTGVALDYTRAIGDIFGKMAGVAAGIYSGSRLGTGLGLGTMPVSSGYDFSAGTGFGTFYEP